MVEKIVAEDVLNKLQQYENVARQYQEFFNQEELGALFDRKADLELVCRLQESKANKAELSKIFQQFENMRLKLQYITVFQAELAE